MVNFFVAFLNPDYLLDVIGNNYFPKYIMREGGKIRNYLGLWGKIRVDSFFLLGKKH